MRSCVRGLETVSDVGHVLENWNREKKAEILKLAGLEGGGEGGERIDSGNGVTIERRSILKG